MRYLGLGVGHHQPSDFPREDSVLRKIPEGASYIHTDWDVLDEERRGGTDRRSNKDTGAKASGGDTQNGTMDDTEEEDEDMQEDDEDEDDEDESSEEDSDHLEEEDAGFEY